MLAELPTLEVLDFAPAKATNVHELAIKAEWRWEWRMRKYTFGILVRRRGKDRESVMYISKDGDNSEYWRQFIPEYERWQSTGFKRRSKYATRTGDSGKPSVVNRTQDSDVAR